MNPIVYKYRSPERISDLACLKIRLSQPRILNDPFEELIRFNMKPEEYNKNNTGVTNRLSKKTREFVFDILEKEINKATNKAISDRFGLISLSKNDSNLLMWSHYANNYKGYVIGFDSSSCFFNTKIKGLDSPIQEVNYSYERKAFGLPNIFIKDGMLCEKPIDWSYEEEVRYIDTITDEEMQSQKDKIGFPIVLRNIPKDAIKEIIIGPKSILESKIRDIINKQKLDVALFKMELDNKEYCLNKVKIR